MVEEAGALETGDQPCPWESGALGHLAAGAAVEAGEAAQNLGIHRTLHHVGTASPPLAHSQSE